MLIAMNKKKTAAETLGSRLQGLMIDYGLSPEKLAEIVEMSGVSIRSIVKGGSAPYRNTVERLADALGSTYEYLMNGEGQRLPNGKKSFHTKSKTGAMPWEDEAWSLAKEQLAKKDQTIDRLAVSFDRLTEFMSKIDPSSFLYSVRATGTDN